MPLAAVGIESAALPHRLLCFPPPLHKCPPRSTWGGWVAPTAISSMTREYRIHSSCGHGCCISWTGTGRVCLSMSWGLQQRMGHGGGLTGPRGHGSACQTSPVRSLRVTDTMFALLIRCPYYSLVRRSFHWGGSRVSSPRPHTRESPPWNSHPLLLWYATVP